MKVSRASRIALAATALLAGTAFAQVKVGITVSATGPAASLGIPEKNTVALLPKEIAGKKIEYIVLDDASDTTTAVKNTRKLITEDKVDLVIGSTVTPNSLAMVDVVAESESRWTPSARGSSRHPRTIRTWPLPLPSTWPTTA
jgi:branched-chain amino acid transport system substrate-binding protein